MSNEKVKRIDISEFREEGYLQEVNRRFFHPLGLALEIIVEEDGSSRIGGVWDYREDCEGIYFAGSADPEKAENIDRLLEQRKTPRIDALGFFIEPVNDEGIASGSG